MTLIATGSDSVSIAPEASIGRREQAKAERRSRIVQATYALLREVGMDGISIKLVAERAEVSAATVYNLFGTKNAILKQVLDLDLEQFEIRVARLKSADALQRIFDAVHVAARLYQEDPGFYRATMLVRPVADAPDVYAARRDPRLAFWRSMVEGAVAEGHLRRDVNDEVLGTLLNHITAGVLGDWIAQVISVRQLEREICFGFAVALHAFATAQAEPVLSARIAEMQASLSVGHRRL